MIGTTESLDIDGHPHLLTAPMRQPVTATPQAFQTRQRLTTSRRPKEERWSSSLSETDLARLLHVIENQLIPQLLSSYSPARCSPLDPR